MSTRPGRAPLAPRGRASLLVALITPALLASACSAIPTISGPSPDPSTSPAPSTAAEIDLSLLPVPRTSFCHVLDGAEVAEALDGPVTDTAHYGNGDEVELRPGFVDVSHEYGCTYEGDGAVARVWVFARPVTEAEARTLVRRARRGRDCAFPEPLRFGRPGLTSVCKVPGLEKEGPTVRVRLEGLFGDSWLGCEVSELQHAAPGDGARADVARRAEQWCTDVVTTVGAQP